MVSAVKGQCAVIEDKRPTQLLLGETRRAGPDA